MKKAIYILLTFFMLQSASGMKIEYQYDDCEEEHHTGAFVMLESKDTNPNLASMQSNYNRLGAAILKGANDTEKRYIHIKNITDKHIDFTRALIRKAYEIATQREVPIRMSFFSASEQLQEMLTNEWAPLQINIDKFYVNPWGKALSGEDDSD